MSRQDNAIAGKHLGQKSDYAERYDPSLLVGVPRQPNRDNIGVDSKNTPWKRAYDVWNCYEVSSLLQNGMPFSGIGKLVYDGNSECIVESKSLKLYLNSFNQERCPADNYSAAFRYLKEIIENDLSKLLKTDVRITIHPSNHQHLKTMTYEEYLALDADHSLNQFHSCDDVWGYSVDAGIEYKKYTEDKTLLGTPEKITRSFGGHPVFTLHSTNLFSRCQITNQPDHGDVFVAYQGGVTITEENFNLYIASLRGHSCFHEPTVETIYKHLYDLVNPERLLVAALYTRRGGISIAPVRAMDDSFIPYNLVNHRVPHVKLPRE